MNDVVNRKTVLIASAASVLIMYLIWEVYWCTQVGLIFVKWHTHLMLYVYMELFVFLLYKIFNGAAIKNSFLLLGSVLFALFVLEAFLCISGKYKTNPEKVSGSYISPYELLIKKNPYHVWPINTAHWLERSEYCFSRETNSLGFADPEWSINKKSKEIRILALGDSFTEGDGAPYDSSYVSLMRSMPASQSDLCYVMNAGTCGSDPFFNFINLRDRLLVYKPDIVIQSIGSNDVNSDILIRGGMERFNKLSLVAPWWEPIYAISYVSRVFFAFAGYDQLLQKKHSVKNEKGRIDKSVEGLFKDYADLCRKNNIKLFVIFHPQLDEIEQNYYDYDFNPILTSMKTDTSIKVIDLLPSYRAYIDSTNTQAKNYFWVHDGHHNSRGYKMMAETTLQNILPFIDLKQKQQSQP